VENEAAFQLSQTPPDDDEPYELVPRAGSLGEADSERVLLRNPLTVGAAWSSAVATPAVNGTDGFTVRSVRGPCKSGQLQFDNCAVIAERNSALSLTIITTYAIGVGPVEYRYDGINGRHAHTVLTLEKWHVDK